MIITICHKDTGRSMKRMEETSEAIQRLLVEGHTRVESAPPSPQHCWNGGWVLDQGLVKDKQDADKLVELVNTDQGMVRIVEDLISILITKGVLSINDFHPNAVEKLLKRAALRG